MEDALVAVTAHDIEEASLIVVHVRDTTEPEHCSALGDQLRGIVDDAPVASVVIVHGNGMEHRHEPTQAMLAEVARHAATRGVVLRNG